MNQISPHQLQPGTAIRTSSTRFPLIVPLENLEMFERMGVSFPT